MQSPGSLWAVAAESDESAVLNLGPGSESEGEGPLIVSSGMTMKNFNPARYAGRWYEVASLKLGFAGQGQEDCHCTQVQHQLLRRWLPFFETLILTYPSGCDTDRVSTATMKLNNLSRLVSASLLI